jgi:propanediol utilization protein
VVRSIVAGNELKGIPRKSVAAVVIDRLDGGKSEEACALAKRHACSLESKTGTKGVKQEPLEGMVVEGAVRVGNIESVVARVEGSYTSPSDQIHISVDNLESTHCTSTC